MSFWKNYPIIANAVVVSIVLTLIFIDDPANDAEDNTEMVSPAGPLVPQEWKHVNKVETRISDKIEVAFSSSVASQSSVISYGLITGTGGGGSIPDDDPVNEPPNPHKDNEPPKEIAFNELHGVNLIDPVLNRKEGSTKLSVQKDFVDEYVSKAKEMNFNVFRIPVRWESYVDNKANFLNELVYIVEKTNENNIFVWIDFHHFYATSNWGNEVAKGKGFPKSVVSCYKPTTGYNQDPEVRAFWDDYYLNKVRDSKNSCKRTLDVWGLQADFMKVMIDRVDEYPNMIGYELLNEPHVWEESHYTRLGELHTKIGNELRESTDKTIIFTRETGHGGFGRKPSLEYLILPKITGSIMYIPHVYNVEGIEKHVSRIKSFEQQWGDMGYNVGIGIGEWATQDNQIKDIAIMSEAEAQVLMDSFVQTWTENKWMHTYWAYGDCCSGEGNRLIRDSGELTVYGELYARSIEKYYPVKSTWNPLEITVN